jgi:hypothetical protein
MGWSCKGWPESDIALGVITIVEVPEGVTIADGGGAWIAALPPPQPATPTITQKIVAVKAPQTTKRFLPFADSNAWKPSTQIRSVSAIPTNVSNGIPEFGGKRTGSDGGSTADPLVVTVTLKRAADPFLIDTLDGV